MSDGFPLGNGDNRPPPLTPDTFVQCQTALINMVNNDIPEAWQQGMIDEINTWTSYAVDGDLTQLSGGGAPWDVLQDIRNKHKDDVGTLQGVGDTLAPQFQSGAGALAVGYVRNMQKRVANYTDVDPGDGDRTNGPYITQVAAVLKAAYAVQAAYKKDLYQLAKGTHDAIQALGDGGGAGYAVGLLVLGLVKVGVGAATAMIGAGEISAAVFAKNVVTGVRDLVFNDGGLKSFQIGGTLPSDISRNLNQGITQVTQSYVQAVQNVMAQMDTIWQSIDSEIRTVPVLQPPPAVDTSTITPLTVGHFFPAG